MKRFFLILMVGFAAMACNKDNSEDVLGNWIKQSDFEGIPRSGAVSFVIDNKIYVGLGYNPDADNEYLNDLWMNDPTGDYWVKVAEFPGSGRTSAVAFVVNGKAYIGTGYNGKTKLKDMYEYDPGTNSWTQKADFGGSARYGAIGFAIGSKGYLGTGYDGNDNRDLWEYDNTTDQWTQTASMGGSKRKYAAAFVVDEKAYVCTGINNGVYQTDLWQFDPTSATWTQKIDLDYDTDWSILRSQAVAFSLNGKGYVGLGEHSGVRNDIWEYDPNNDTWASKTDFEGSARQEAISYIINNRAYIGLGRSGSYYFDDTWEFKPNDEYDDED